MRRFLLVLFLQPMACLAEELPLKSGVYEGLMLAVNNNGEVTGYFNEQQGQGVEKVFILFAWHLFCWAGNCYDLAGEKTARGF